MILDKVTTALGAIVFSGSDRDTLTIVRESGGTIEKTELPKNRKGMAAFLNQLLAEKAK